MPGCNSWENGSAIRQIGVGRGTRLGAGRKRMGSNWAESEIPEGGHHDAIQGQSDEKRSGLGMEIKLCSIS